MAVWVGLIGVVGAAGIAALVSLVAECQSNRRLRLDAAMRAGGLLEPGPSGHADPAASASGLLALTRLGHAQLAVALLVDVWPDGEGREDRVSSETAILVIDAPLRVGRRKRPADCRGAALPQREAARPVPVAALAERGRRLLAAAPRAEGEAAPRRRLGVDDRLECVERERLALGAVRLYGAYDGDPEPHVKGCVGTLIKAIVPELEMLDYTEFMKGTRTVSLAQLRSAAAAAAPNPDRYLAQVVQDRSAKLRDWAARCPQEVDTAAGALAD